MDLHPIVVHFPIALLTLYAVFELLRFKRLTSKSYWFYIKATLALFGALMAIVTYLTGPDIKDPSRLIQMHATFATATFVVFIIIAIGYKIEWIKRTEYASRVPAWLSKIGIFLQKSIIAIALALIGLVCVTITGGLGGAVVYGTDLDPFMKPIFQLLGVY